MPITLFDIPTAFSSGVNLRVLQQELAAIWPADLQLSEFTVDGSAFATITIADLQIETSRALTAPESTAVDALFLAHDPLTPLLPGILKIQLPAAIPENAGHNLFIRDLLQHHHHHAHIHVDQPDDEHNHVDDGHDHGNPVGAPVYSSGAEWRRTADDVPVSAIA